MPEDAGARLGDEEPLVRELNLVTAASIVVGVVIGSGIFIGANRLAQGVTSPFLVFFIWVFAGLLTLVGALTYAEFGAAFPRSGGDYVYIGRSLNPFWGFFSGWITFWINLPWSIAALAVAWASQLDSLKPDPHGVLVAEGFAIRFTAVAVIAVFTIINVFGVRQGGATQKYLTALKLVLIAVVVAFGLSGFADGLDNLAPFFGDAKPAQGGLFAGFALAMVGALWAYDGWSGVTRVAAEVKEPAKNLPRALAYGILTVIGVYLLVTLAYLLILGIEGMAGEGLAATDARLVASRAAEAMLGPAGKTFVAILILVSILGPLNGLTLSGPRVYYAMARDRLFPSFVARVHEVHRTPHLSITLQGVFAAVLALFFSFEVLSNFVVLAAWSQYALTGIGLIVLRRREPDVPRPYKVPLYPWLPGLFVLLSGGFVVYLVLSTTVSFAVAPTAGNALVFWLMLANLALMLLSWPAYRFFRARGDVLGATERSS